MNLMKWIFGGSDACSQFQWDHTYDRGRIARQTNINCLHHAMNAYIDKHPNEVPTTFVDGRTMSVEFIREVYILNRDEMNDLLREHEREVTRRVDSGWMGTMQTGKA